MKAFFDKYPELLTDKMALKAIHKKLHHAIDDSEEGKSITKDILDIRCMIDDYLKAKGVTIPVP